MSPLKTSALFAFAASFALAGTAGAQIRQVQGQPTPPPLPGIQRPSVDPASQALSALSLKLDQLRASVGRQVVVLHFTPTETNGWPDSDNNFPKNSARAEAMCKQALGDRYGRVLSRQAIPVGERWFFPHLVCETAP